MGDLSGTGNLVRVVGANDGVIFSAAKGRVQPQ
jgi:hypothetical protein